MTSHEIRPGKGTKEEPMLVLFLARFLRKEETC
jgi:hypothetical protein